MACTSYECTSVRLRSRLAGKLVKKKVYAETKYSVRIAIVPQASKSSKYVHIGMLSHLNADQVVRELVPNISHLCSTMVYRR